MKQVARKVTTSLSVASLALATQVSSVFAQGDGKLFTGLNLGTNFGFTDAPTTINTVINIILSIAGLAAFVFILWGAFDYVTAGDDAGKTEKARKKITNAVVGLILVALAFVIWSIVINLVGLDGFFGDTGGY